MNRPAFGGAVHSKMLLKTVQFGAGSWRRARGSVWPERVTLAVGQHAAGLPVTPHGAVASQPFGNGKLKASHPLLLLHLKQN